MRRLAVIVVAAIAGCSSTPDHRASHSPTSDLWDASRQRRIPLTLSFPAQHADCSHTKRCRVAFVSPGYGLAHTGYSFIAKALAEAGYMTVAIKHDLPTDPALSRTGDLFANRMPDWQRGVANLRFVRDTLSQHYPDYDWTQLVLIGHSNGGDLSALAAENEPTLATTLITLDNRRYPLPRQPSLNVLSIRASDYQADAGVIPTPQERLPGTCITTIADARHNDMTDRGPASLKTQISLTILRFLNTGVCPA